GDRKVRIIGVEAGGHGGASGQHGATLSAGRPGILHGSMSYLLQNDDGQVATAHSISAGLDYPGVGPEHAYYRDLGRFEFTSVTDEEALQGFQTLTRTEGIMPRSSPRMPWPTRSGSRSSSRARRRSSSACPAAAIKT